MSRSTYPLPPYERMGRSVVRIQLDVRVSPELAEAAHDLLREAGSDATQELEGPIVRGCFADVPRAVAAREAVLALDPDAKWSLDQTLWFDLETHYALFRPIETAKFWVGPPWRAHEAPKKKHRIVVSGDDVVFGDLGHPTTALGLIALERLKLKGLTVLDAGCGTGVLAIAARLLGARSVHGVELDSIEPARALAKAHRVKVKLEQGDVSQLTGGYDVVVCNMHLHHLVPMVPRVLALARRALILTGFPARYREQVLGELKPSHLDELSGFEAATLTRT